MSDELKSESERKIQELNDALFKHLNTKSEDTQGFDKKLNAIFDFIKTNRESISGGTREKLFRFLRDVVESSDNLIAIHSHRTPISLKAYCLIFIYIFPVVYTPTIINKIGLENPTWLTFFIVVLSEFILISLYNIQDQMEYPFDDEGLDDIKFKLFKIDR
jgi:predicted membrane chloride channel (bestrophin family)